jgi:hypothetical protein
MGRPKGTTAKTWKTHLRVMDVNRAVVKDRMKKSLYVPGPFDELFLDEDGHRARGRRRKPHRNGKR